MYRKGTYYVVSRVFVLVTFTSLDKHIGYLHTLFIVYITSL